MYVNRYLKLGYILGGFEELNFINLEIIRETAFCDKKLMYSPAADEHENDVYEDEEIELSVEDELDNIDDKDKNISIFAKVINFLKELSNCSRFKAE